MNLHRQLVIQIREDPSRIASEWSGASGRARGL